MNRTLRGWANYFKVGTVSKAYRAIDHRFLPRDMPATNMPDTVEPWRDLAKDMTDWDGSIKTNWDRWRAEFTKGNRASSPRDAFESFLAQYAEAMTEAADEIERLPKTRLG